LSFRTLYAAFGLNPIPYHAVNLAVHLLNVGLVYGIGRMIHGARSPACIAGLLFGVSSIAFTPLHWATGLHELQASMLALAAFALYLAGRFRDSPVLLWTGAVVGLAAFLTKENTVLLPLLLVIVETRLFRRATSPAPKQGSPKEGHRGASTSVWPVLAPQWILGALFAIAYALTWHQVPVVAAAAYHTSLAPRFLAFNLGTYLAWSAWPVDPIRDVVATVHPERWVAGLALALVMLAALWTQRKAARHPEEVGIAAFILFLLPVLPLISHTYLYYLYLPWAGVSWWLGGTLTRTAGRWYWGVVAIVVVLLGFTALEYHNVRERARLRVHGLARDKTLRESELLRNSIEDLRAARLPSGSHVLLVNPGQAGYFDVAGGDTSLRALPARQGAYLPLEAALRGGEALRVFVPGLTLDGFSTTIEEGEERAYAFWFKGNGDLDPLGTGSLALAQVGEMHASVEGWDEARRLYLRTRTRGDTLAPATAGLAFVESMTGHDPEARAYAREFIRRWPSDPRAPLIAAALRAPGPLRLE